MQEKGGANVGGTVTKAAAGMEDGAVTVGSMRSTVLTRLLGNPTDKWRHGAIGR